jgi:gamma-glutamyltranspeptidase
MLQTPCSLKGMVTSPHHLASQAGLDVLKSGGTAVEAAIAVGATLAVVYPHMTGIGGDGFWLISEGNSLPIAIDGSGRAGTNVSLEFYRSRGLNSIPSRGPMAANTVAGTISGWKAALDATAHWGTALKLEQVLEAAIDYASSGIVVTQSQADLTRQKLAELQDQPGFADVFLPSGNPPLYGARLKQPALAETLRHLASKGFDSFYRGELGRSIAADLARAGSPITAQDLAAQDALVGSALSTVIKGASLFNHRPPTQGLSSLMILALFDRLAVVTPESFDHIHGLVESTKQAFLVRDAHVGDPGYMTTAAETFLDDTYLDRLATRISREKALEWPQPAQLGDTVWIGVMDNAGRAVSFIQSIYFEYGSGVILPETGICWQNRGASFRLAEDGWNHLKPGRKPFHTLNPAIAYFDDGRRLVYGTMGGEGQPQTQAAVFSRYGIFGAGLQEAVTAPRWLLGRTWGAESASLKIESRVDSSVVNELRTAGHDVEVVDAFTSQMGHAGAIVCHPGGLLEGATDPRSDGAVAAW